MEESKELPLLKMCMIVKNAPAAFESVLMENKKYIDCWCILDTGSTDVPADDTESATVRTIERVLGNVPGKLYREKFVNFRDSRNRCLELAGTDCKFVVMLDDSYVLPHNLRFVLQDIFLSRSEFDTFSVLIKDENSEYFSNRIFRPEKKPRYINTVHEVVQSVNTACLPRSVFIRDVGQDLPRSLSRKEDDLRMLQDLAKSDPQNPRHVYYIAETLLALGRKEDALEQFKKRKSIKEGDLFERVQSAFQIARISEVEWNEREKLYLECFEIDRRNPIPLYYIGVQYGTTPEGLGQAYDYLKKAFLLDYEVEYCRYTKPIYYYLPLYLVQIAWLMKDYSLANKCCARFFEKNDDEEAAMYEFMKKWQKFIVENMANV